MAIVLIRKEHIDLLRTRTRRVNVRLSSDPAKVHKASISLISPASTTDLPTPALATIGGGEVSLDPTSEAGMRALDDLFLVELKLPPLPELNRIGEHVHVRFDHGWLPLGIQAARSLRQTFLEKFGV